jgi:hypothetical protein
MVRAIFIISNSFNIEPYAKYLAVHLLDKYMSCFFWELISSYSELTEITMRQVYDKMACQMKLVLASCLQIASKVDLYKTGLGISQVPIITIITYDIYLSSFREMKTVGSFICLKSGELDVLLFGINFVLDNTVGLRISG